MRWATGWPQADHVCFHEQEGEALVQVTGSNILQPQQDRPQPPASKSFVQRSNQQAQSDHMYNAFKDYEGTDQEYEVEPAKSKAINERRLQELQHAGIDADLPNAQLDRLAKLCASIFEVAGVTITLYCGEELVVKSSCGLDARVPRHLSMKLAIGSWATYMDRPHLLVVPDVTLDARHVAVSPINLDPTQSLACT